MTEPKQIAEAEQWAKDVAIDVLQAWENHPADTFFDSIALTIQAAFAEREARLVEALEKLYRGYVRTLESGRERITFLGGECDPVERMENDDPALIEVRAAIAAIKEPST